MRAVDICLAHSGHVNILVNITNRYPFTISLRQGRYVVDGKSVLGVCSLQHSQPIQLEAYSDHCEALFSDLAPLLD